MQTAFMECSSTIVNAVFFIFLSTFSVSYSGVIVAKDGSGDYTTLSEAIANAPDHNDEPYSIHVRPGIYEEYVLVPNKKTNIRLIGENPQNTKIVGTQSSTSVDIHGAGFMAKNMGFVNSAGRNGGAAVAVRNEATNTIFYQCSIEGYQDTLWAVSGRQYYKNCDIYGTVDFIYGDAAAVFQDCMIYARYREFVTFTAQSRENPNENTGFTFQRCIFTMSPEDSDKESQVHATLGRPWRAYSTVAIIQSYIDSIVDPRGWEQMPGRPVDHVTYVEFDNVGPGSGTEGRVNWTGVRVLSDSEDVVPFTASALLDGDSWIPLRGVPYQSGL